MYDHENKCSIAHVNICYIEYLFFLILICVCVFLRNPGPVARAAEMSGPADGDEGPAAAGPPGLLQEESRD